MKSKSIVILVLFFAVFYFIPIKSTYPGNTAQQIVNFTIQQIFEVSVSGNPQALVISAVDPSYPNGEYDLLSQCLRRRVKDIINGTLTCEIKVCVVYYMGYV